MAAFLLEPAVVRPDEAGLYRQFIDRAVGQSTLANIDRAQLLDDLPRLSTPSYAPLAALHTLLCQLPGQWPVLHLQRTYVEIWTSLPEEAKAGRAPAAAQNLLDAALKACKLSYGSLLNLYHPDSTAAAIIDPESGRAAHHNDITSVVRKFRLPLPAFVNGRKPVVAVSLPNGPLLALAVLSVTTYYTAAPVAHGNGVGAEQFKTDVLGSRSNMVIASPNDVERLGLREAWLADAGIPVLLAELSDGMNLTLRRLDGTPINEDGPATRATEPVPNAADDTGIMLFTSGTSGTKKLVPLSIHSMICGVAMVVRSWGLSPCMRCLNQMPLNHVGGLIRNLFAPVLSGGSVICCPAFDANLFWDCVEDHAPTWYYASPTMHQGILEAGIDRPESMAKSEIRLVCNAAGGLLPSLAITLRDTFSTDRFDCTVLPSYGMTECMPISTPPLDYRLEKTGTSGISVGPEIAILNGRDDVEDTGEVGRICVRGAPVFGGYLKANDVVDTSCFTRDGWFDTGDMGYLDAEGYLYITGRSKEVINRGGELISPFEVEEAIVAAACRPESPIFGRVSKALAFSVTHDVLQEVVGIAIVTPDQAPRACLRGIQQAVRSVLNQVKVPVVIVYMNGGLPTNNNKVLRIRLAERLGLPEISDDTPHSERYYEAVCPPPNTPLSVNIDSTPLDTTHDAIAEACRPVLPKHVEFHIRPDASDFYPELILAPRKDSTITVDDSTLSGLTQNLSKDLHGYHMPLKVMRVDVPLPRNPFGDVDDDMLSGLLKPKKHAAVAVATAARIGVDQNTTEARVAAIFAHILCLDEGDVNGRSDFFELGGNSMAAGRLLSALRKEFNLRLPIDVLFTNRQVGELARLINEKLGREDPQAIEQGVASETSLLPGCEKTCSSTNPVLMFLQLLPIGLLYPMKRALTWTVFMYFLTFTQGWVTNLSIPGRLLDLVVSMAVGRLVTKTVAPFVAIAFKWLVIGRYAQGLYPMWGSYHTRWWMTEKVVCICGMGLFGYFDWSRVLYYRMLGARIGRNVSINKGASLGEWDLIAIGDNVVLERCSVRAFAAERNTSMYLGKVTIGNNCSVGLCSTVAAGTSLPDNACVGPNSSSWEVADADEANRDLAASKIPEAHWLLQIVLGLPLLLITKFVGLIPWLGCLIALVRFEPGKSTHDELRVIVIWFASPTRVAFHYSAFAANVSLGPIFFLLAFLAIKKTFDFFCGKIVPSPVEGRSTMTTFRRQLYNQLMPAPQFHKATSLFGGHYATTSVFARALGAKVGKRVYWPGTGPSVQDWDLLNIGDDVVFGSRSHMVTSDGTGSDFVRIGSGAMVADRVVLLPGVELGDKVVMGSGAMTKRNKQYAADSTWVGSKRGEAVCLTVDTSASVSANTQAAPIPNYSSYNSSDSTLVKTGESERSSIDAIKADHGTPNLAFPDEAPKDGGKNVKVNEKSSESSASSTIEATSDESSSPFGRAFYQGKASYRVWSQFEIFVYSTLITVASGVYWNVGSISAVQVVGFLFRTNNPIIKHFLAEHLWWRPLSLYLFFLALIVGIMAAQSIVVIAGTILAKWIIMGRRQQGNYDWDKSSYCQRWQLFLKLEAFRRQCYGGHGILGLLSGTAWLSLYFRALGARIGRDCALFAGGAPSLMFTEPDLLTLGDRVSVDDASLVAHINTRGKFDLNPLHVGARSVLRSGSRLLSGARMEEDTCLLEHTLVMAGDVIDAGVCAQGWPAEEFAASRTPTLEVARIWKVKS